LETDRREIRRRIAYLKGEIQRVREHRQRHRQQREVSQIPTVALVGYTNAGKSTMLNRLSGATTYTADQLFATLDPTVRRVDLPGGRTILLTDTVGFIQKLPTTLIAAFRATLEEVNNADLLVHVVDASHPNAAQQLTIVEDMLANELNVGDVPIIVALNKIDRISAENEADPLEEFESLTPNATPISALTGAGMPHLLAKIEAEIARQHERITVAIPYSEAALIARFHAVATVTSREETPDHVKLVGSLAPRYASEFRAYRVR
jgi:GTP-binding protein HflX